jgi:hypothetical protein
VIALGEIDDEGAPTYLPDSIVVLFEKDVAEPYWITGDATLA